jgi:hypothetical protein
MDAFVRIGRDETFCSIRLDLIDAYVGIGIGETLCSKFCRLDLMDAFVRIGTGETQCSIRLDLLDAFVRIGRGETLCSIGILHIGEEQLQYYCWLEASTGYLLNYCIKQFDKAIKSVVLLYL